MHDKINVYSEVGKLKKVLVHTPGKELDYLTPQRLDELLFSAVMDPERAREEHREFIKILEDHGVEVVQLVDLTTEAYNDAPANKKEQFIQDFLDQVTPKLTSENRKIMEAYLKSFKDPKEMIKKMMSGILARELNVKSDVELLADPIPNLLYTRDPFASAGNGVIINHMFKETRRRESLFSNLIFSEHHEYKQTPRFYESTDKYTIEGGDIFVYNDKTLVVGISERTQKEAVQLLAENIQKDKDVHFETIYAINVPKMPNLMHLDTWLTMLDTNKFLYSPNMMKVLKIWKIDLKNKPLKWEEINESLEDFLSEVIGEKAITIPVAGKDALQIDIDVETHFDATNYLAIEPGLVVGYDRNRKTQKALEDAGIKVLGFNGDQLSLGMGSARCMSMPLYREPVKK